jgi:hypothetical protein
MRSTPWLPGLRPLALAGALVGAAAPAAAADPLPNRQCGGGVCLANVDAALAVAPCRNANVAIAWAQAGGAMSIECSTNDVLADQPIYVFDRRDLSGPAYDLTGIRAFPPEALPQLAHVPGEGTDALLPACRRPSPPTMAPGELLLTEKAPSDNERHPDCYRVLRVATSRAGIAIRADDGKPPKAGAANPEWRELANRMAALAAQADAQARTRVTRRRAALRDRPDPKTAPHGFLIAGDPVVVLERNGPGGFARVLYTPAKGPAIERWIAAGDLAP